MVLKPPPYSLDLTTMQVLVVPEAKELLHGVNFETREELIAEVREQLKLMPTSAFWECFQKWIHRANKTCDYVEKGKMFKTFSGFGLLPRLGKSGTSLEHSDGDLRQRPKRRN